MTSNITPSLFKCKDPEDPCSFIFAGGLKHMSKPLSYSAYYIFTIHMSVIGLPGTTLSALDECPACSDPLPQWAVPAQATDLWVYAFLISLLVTKAT